MMDLKRRNTSSCESSPEGSPSPKRLRFDSAAATDSFHSNLPQPASASEPNDSLLPPSHTLRTSLEGEAEEGEYDEVPLTFQPAEEPRTHPVYGQRGAFPGLGDPDTDELFYGPAGDGIEYLRMVRSEARTLPTIFTAPRDPPTLNNPDAKSLGRVASRLLNGGYYSNGAYTATPTSMPHDNAAKSLSHSHRFAAQSSYHDLLLARFKLLRSTLSCAPPIDSISNLTPSQPITFRKDSNEARRQWRHILQEVEPTMVQIACMDNETVLKVLGLVYRIFGGIVIDASDSISLAIRYKGRGPEYGHDLISSTSLRIFSAWCWALLGKVRDVGQLSSEEVSEIRALGKKARELLKIIHDPNGERCADKDEDPADLDDLDFVDENEAEEEARSFGPEYGSPLKGPVTAQKTLDSNLYLLAGDPLNQELKAAKVRLRTRLARSTTTNVTSLPSTPPPKTESKPQEKTRYEHDPDPDPDPEAAAAAEAERDPANEPEKIISERKMKDKRTDRETTGEFHERLLAFLDMVITIVGDIFGQRDLLEDREVW